MDNIFTEKELNDPEVKKCYYHLENYTNCLENKNIYFKECYNKFFLSFVNCSKLYHKIYL